MKTEDIYLCEIRQIIKGKNNYYTSVDDCEYTDAFFYTFAYKDYETNQYIDAFNDYHYKTHGSKYVYIDDYIVFYSVELPLNKNQLEPEIIKKKEKK